MEAILFSIHRVYSQNYGAGKRKKNGKKKDYLSNEDNQWSPSVQKWTWVGNIRVQP